jgi:hypothetical protein
MARLAFATRRGTNCTAPQQGDNKATIKNRCRDEWRCGMHCCVWAEGAAASGAWARCAMRRDPADRAHGRSGTRRAAGAPLSKSTSGLAVRWAGGQGRAAPPAAVPKPRGRGELGGVGRGWGRAGGGARSRAQRARRRPRGRPAGGGCQGARRPSLVHKAVASPLYNRLYCSTAPIWARAPQTGRPLWTAWRRARSWVPKRFSEGDPGCVAAGARCLVAFPRGGLRGASCSAAGAARATSLMPRAQLRRLRPAHGCAATAAAPRAARSTPPRPPPPAARPRVQMEADALRARVAQLEEDLANARADAQATAIAHDQQTQARGASGWGGHAARMRPSRGAAARPAPAPPTPPSAPSAVRPTRPSSPPPGSGAALCRGHRGERAHAAAAGSGAAPGRGARQGAAVGCGRADGGRAPGSAGRGGSGRSGRSRPRAGPLAPRTPRRSWRSSAARASGSSRRPRRATRRRRRRAAS